jgi:nucleoside-diphosphate-sugar epimerase
MSRKRVVITGACGYVVQRNWEELNERYDVVALDVTTRRGDGREVAGVQVCDLTEESRDAYRTHFAGADAVYHCAFVSAPGLDAGNFLDNSDAKFRAELANVAMAYNVYRTALEEGVKRVVVASSNHAADFYERLIWSGRWDCVTADMNPLSDNWYGWAKAAYEHLGFVFATGQGLPGHLEVVQLRIGGPRDDADLPMVPPGDVKKMHRGLGAYLSRRDQAQLVMKSIEARDIRNEHGVPFQVFYGVSGNTHNFWSIANARRVIGYAPQDDSQVTFADAIAAIAKG